MKPDFSQIDYRPRPRHAAPAAEARRARVDDPRAHPGEAAITRPPTSPRWNTWNTPPEFRLSCAGRTPRCTRCRPWTIRQYAGFSTAEDSNAFYRRNLAAGQKGLSVAFDLATHRGYDSDNERVTGDVGKAGVAIDSVEDMKILFDQIPLDQMSVSMTMNGAVLPIMAFYVVAAEEQGVAPEQARRHHAERHPERVHGPQHLYLPARRRPCASSAISSATPRRTCRSSTPFRSAAITCRKPGPPPTSNSAYTLADGLEYIRTGIAAGLDIDDFAPRLSFFWGIGMNHFMEIAKLRAARVLWAKLVKRFNPQRIPSRWPCARTAKPRAGA